MSPEVLLMYFISGLLDLTGIVLLCFGLDDFGITDIIGLIFIGGWILFRSQNIKAVADLKTTTTKAKTAQKKATVKIGKAVKNMKWTRFICVFGELIPYIGALPLWTVLVHGELKNNP